MAGQTPQQIAADWQAKMAASATKIKNKVNAMTESPMAKAAASVDLMRRNWLAAMDSGRIASALQAVPLQSWKAAMTGKGLQNMQSGLADGATKVAQFQQIAQPVFEQARAAAAAIPKDGTDQTALAKVQAAMTAMRTLKGVMKGRQ